MKRKKKIAYIFQQNKKIEKNDQDSKLSDLEKERFVDDWDHKYESWNAQYGEHKNWKSAE